MASPKTAAPPSPAVVSVAAMSVMTSAGTTVTKVDIGTSVTPVKAVPEFPSSAAAAGQQHYSTAVGVSVNGVQISRRLQLPDDESAALTKEPAPFSSAAAAAVEEMETADVLLECREVFDDSFEKSGDEEMEEAAKNTTTTEAEEIKAAKDSGEIPAASQLSVQAAAGSVSQPAAASLEPLDLLKPLPEPAVPDGRVPPLAVRTNEFGLVEVVTAALAAQPAASVNPRVGVKLKQKINSKLCFVLNAFKYYTGIGSINDFPGVRRRKLAALEREIVKLLKHEFPSLCVFFSSSGQYLERIQDATCYSFLCFVCERSSIQFVDFCFDTFFPLGPGDGGKAALYSRLTAQGHHGEKNTGLLRYVFLIKGDL
jgi:hypothetical protein